MKIFEDNALVVIQRQKSRLNRTFLFDLVAKKYIEQKLQNHSLGTK